MSRIGLLRHLERACEERLTWLLLGRAERVLECDALINELRELIDLPAGGLLAATLVEREQEQEER